MDNKGGRGPALRAEGKGREEGKKGEENEIAMDRIIVVRGLV